MKLTDAIVRQLPVPAAGYLIRYDRMPGFGVRVTAAGARSFVLRYRSRAGRQSTYTIGAFPDWQATAARDEARRLKRLIDQGSDPTAEIAAERGAPTVTELCDRFLDEHVPRKAAATRKDYRGLIERHLRPALGRLKVADVAFADADALHRRITKRGAPSAANKTILVAHKMFELAAKWGWRDSANPFKRIERNRENARKRYVTPEERPRLARAIEQHRDRQAAAIFEFVMLTGCRIGEALAARWDDIDLARKTWSKPATATKQRRDHIVPLSKPAVSLLAGLRQKTNSEWVFPSPAANGSSPGHRIGVAKNWREVCRAAGIKGLRVHDLRHSFASELVSSGASLPLIGALLGHSNPATTARYSHLYDDPQRAAVERVGAVISRAGKRP
jgi:integrase